MNSIQQIQFYRLVSPNGLYAVTISWNTGGAGGGSFPSVWNEPFADYREAIKHGVAELEESYAYAMKHIADSCIYNERKIKQLIAKLKEIKRQYLEPSQLSLFDFV